MISPHTRRFLLAFMILLASAGTVFASDFGALRAFMQDNVDQGRALGCAAQVTQGGETIFLEAFGDLDPAGTRELDTDDIVRIYSMSKAITTVAAMALMEDGKLGIDDPVSKYIPEFAEVTVAYWPEGIERTPENMQRVAPQREITVRDLILHTSGLAYNFSAEEGLKKIYADPWLNQPNLASAIRQVATVPLAVQPGTQFLYGLNSDVLGRVVEVASGMPFEDFLEVRIFEPLQMNDTAFTPGPAERSMPIVKKSAVTGTFKIDPTRVPGYSNSPGKHLPLGGQGLFSTLNDYTRFCQMVLQGGQLDGERILEERTVTFMGQNHLGPDLNPGNFRFGLGFKVNDPVETSHGPRGEDRLSWGGAASTYFFIDPKQDLTAVFITQLVPYNGPMGEEFHATVLESVAAEEPLPVQK